MHPSNIVSAGVIDRVTGVKVVVGPAVTVKEDGAGVEGGSPVGGAVPGEEEGAVVEGGSPVGEAV